MQPLPPPPQPVPVIIALPNVPDINKRIEIIHSGPVSVCGGEKPKIDNPISVCGNVSDCKTASTDSRLNCLTSPKEEPPEELIQQMQKEPTVIFAPEPVVCGGKDKN